MSANTDRRLCGLVLAAGSGSRFGGPKALARSADGTPWTALAVRMLRDAGCERVIVALGARSDEAAALVPDTADIRVVDDWADGVSATLRAGLAAASRTDADALVVTPVDTPAAPAAAVTRLLDALGGSLWEGAAQAVYDGRPGHPVIIGRGHWTALASAVSGDRGARAYLATHGVLDIDCADLWNGADIDSRAS